MADGTMYKARRSMSSDRGQSRPHASAPVRLTGICLAASFLLHLRFGRLRSEPCVVGCAGPIRERQEHALDNRRAAGHPVAAGLQLPRGRWSDPPAAGRGARGCGLQRPQRPANRVGRRQTMEPLAVPGGTDATAEAAPAALGRRLRRVGAAAARRLRSAADAVARRLRAAWSHRAVRIAGPSRRDPDAAAAGRPRPARLLRPQRPPRPRSVPPVPAPHDGRGHGRQGRGRDPARAGVPAGGDVRRGPSRGASGDPGGRGQELPLALGGGLRRAAAGDPEDGDALPGRVVEGLRAAAEAAPGRVDDHPAARARRTSWGT